MSELHLVVGNYNTSSRSLAVWLVLRRAGVVFELRSLDLRAAAGLEEAERMSPSGRLPVLEIGDRRICEPLAICEFVAERSPELWPRDPVARAEARALAAEAVYELDDLLTFLPMDMTGRFTSPGKLLRGVRRDLDRLEELWRERLAGVSGDGPFLFGGFTIADAFMAPVVARLETHGIAVGEVAEAYARAIRELPEYGEWAAMAAREVAGETPRPVMSVRPAVSTRPQPDAPPPETAPSPPAKTPASTAKTPPETATPAPVPPEPVPGPPTGADRLFGRGRAGRRETAPPAVTPAVPAEAAEAPVPPATRTPAESGAPDSAASPATPRETAPGAATGKAPPRSAAPTEATTGPTRTKRPRPAPSGPIVKPIGDGIRRRR